MYLSGVAPLPAEYHFLPLAGVVARAPGGLEQRVLLAVDCANERRIGPEREPVDRAGLVVNVDHHHDNNRFGAVNLVVDDASSTAEIVRDILGALDVPLTPGDRRGSVRRPRHRHRPLPVHEHDAEGTAAGGRARRSRRGRA